MKKTLTQADRDALIISMSDNTHSVHQDVKEVGTELKNIRTHYKNLFRVLSVCLLVYAVWTGFNLLTL